MSWNTTADGSGIPYADGASFGFSADITLYAQWAAAPEQVTGVAGSAGATTGEINLTWTAPDANGSAITGYTLQYRVTGGTGLFATAADTDGSDTDIQATILGLDPDTAYDFRVLATNAMGSGDVSSAIVVTTAAAADPSAPLRVTGLSATSGDQRVALSWSSPGNGGSAITDYVTERSTNGVSAWTTEANGTSTATSYTVTGLSNGSEYWFRVSATNSVGTGIASSIFSATPAAPSYSSGGSGGGATTSTTTTVTTPARTSSVVAPVRVIVPTQPTPIPRALSAPVRSPGRGFDPSVGIRATIGGAPATVSITPLTNRGVMVRSGSLQMGFNVSGNGGGVSTNPASNTPELTVPTGQSTRVTGGGLLPGSQMQVWLPGATGLTPRELARVSVGSDGTFDSQLSFTANRSQTPIPIGRQVMQVTGYDADGNQTVVDMTINIAQGSPAPEPNRVDDALPELQPGQSLATSAGVPEIVTIEARPDSREVAVTSGEWAFKVSLPADGGAVEQGAAGGATVTLMQSRTATVSGDGFQPGTRVDVWLFSTPTLLGSVEVGADGSFAGDIYLDSRIAVTGEHTLQLQGVAMDGFITAANLGVVVQESVVLATTSATTLMVWVGLIAALVAVLFLVALLVALRRRRFVKGSARNPRDSANSSGKMRRQHLAHLAANTGA